MFINVGAGMMINECPPPLVRGGTQWSGGVHSVVREVHPGGGDVVITV